MPLHTLPPPEHRILNDVQTLQKIRRLAFEIYEDNFEENAITVAGIEGTGYGFARLLVAELEKNTPLTTRLEMLSLDKSAPVQGEVKLSCPPENLIGQPVVIADDVLNTGRTLTYSLKPFLGVTVKSIKIAVLVDRNHRLFPVSADYTGYGLSTTVNEHIEVRLNEAGNFGVYLY